MGNVTSRACEKREDTITGLHGQSDLRCPQEQGEQMYMAMRKNNVPTKMILFPQSSHGLSRQGLPNLRQARLKAITDWFEEYSK